MEVSGCYICNIRVISLWRRHKKQVNEDVSMDSVNGVCDGLKTLQLDEVKVTWIQDNAKERLMERTLLRMLTIV